MLDPPGKPGQQAVHYPSANFRPLSSGSVTNPMFIKVFDTHLSPKSPGP